ncbi:membrane bound O-acyl transferase family-domain-containing protein [Amylostereum chailletii]|nr:membrane bound O-acyl transferase family-domain-containing protein [Amylostereum chailletii]
MSKGQYIPGPHTFNLSAFIDNAVAVGDVYWPFSSMYPRADERVHITQRIFLTEFYPVLCAFYVLAVLVQLPDTRKIRLAILVPMAALAWRAATKYEYAPSMPVEDGYNIYSFAICWFLSFIMLRAADFATSERVFQRIEFSTLPPNAPHNPVAKFRAVVLDAFDLTFNARGIGWNWGKNIYIPPKTTGDGSHKAKSALDHFVSFVKIQFFFDFLLFGQQSWTLSLSEYLTHPAGGTIFDPTLPPLFRYGKVAAMTFLCGLGLCCSFQATYDAVAYICIVLLGQKPEQWPPLFQEPWRAESLADFWGVRWHQVFKRAFVVCGAKPASKIFGRAGGLLGAFFVSGIMHDFGVWGAGLGTDPAAITLFFMMMGVGCMLEVIWQQKTGMKVGGVMGRVWALAWTVFWGSLIVDAWARRGLVISKMSPDAARPALYWAKVVQKWMSLHGTPFS